MGLTLFSNTINGGAFDDPQNATQLWRYLSNNISVAAGDAACNTGDPRATRICYINNGQEDDMRFFQASGPLELAPGAFGSIVVAYIFAAPVSVGACVGPGTCDSDAGRPDPPQRSGPLDQRGCQRGGLGVRLCRLPRSDPGGDGGTGLDLRRAWLDAGQGAGRPGSVPEPVPAPVRSRDAGILPDSGQQQRDRALAAIEQRDHGRSVLRHRQRGGDTGRRAEPALRSELSAVRRRGLPGLPGPGGLAWLTPAAGAVRLRRHLHLRLPGPDQSHYGLRP